MLDGLQSVPARRHPHIDEGHGVRTTLRDRLSGQGNAFPSLMRRIDVEVRPDRRGGGRAKQVCFEQIQGGLRGLIGLDAEDLAKSGLMGALVSDKKMPPAGGPGSSNGGVALDIGEV